MVAKPSGRGTCPFVAVGGAAEPKLTPTHLPFLQQASSPLLFVNFKILLSLCQLYFSLQSKILMIQFDRESNYAESGALFGKGGSQMTQFNVEYVLENNLNTL